MILPPELWLNVYVTQRGWTAELHRSPAYSDARPLASFGDQPSSDDARRLALEWAAQHGIRVDGRDPAPPCNGDTFASGRAWFRAVGVGMGPMDQECLCNRSFAAGVHRGMAVERALCNATIAQLQHSQRDMQRQLDQILGRLKSGLPSLPGLDEDDHVDRRHD